ncbi:uncharacterized protein LOC112350276 [Selaginella moellendorffii]|uniref:uncharacterized protein LOC112350276 n=1 Tax=Selaginella moellendorffii TaxID=88036 RepID=UPI000D1C4E21|nr:uncharacterized protein LOC112350276 [Selaginella moellendorffii]|eukprot:XP_024541948.1 uncharacterized protein LOC112350276 [Selaginella moellendorffii]
MKKIIASLLLLLFSTIPVHAVTTFQTRNNCDFTLNVQMHMEGDHTALRNVFTLEAGGTGQVPVESTAALSGSFYITNLLPSSIAEFQLNSGHSGDTDFYGIGFSRGSVPLAISPTAAGCKSIQCRNHYCHPKMVPCPSGGDYIITFCP